MGGLGGALWTFADCRCPDAAARTTCAVCGAAAGDEPRAIAAMVLFDLLTFCR